MLRLKRANDACKTEAEQAMLSNTWRLLRVFLCIVHKQSGWKDFILKNENGYSGGRHGDGYTTYRHTRVIEQQSCAALSIA